MNIMSQWWDRLIQSVVWQSFFGHFQWNDWALVALIIAGAIYGAKKGFWRMTAEIFRLFFVVILTFHYDEILTNYLSRYIGFFPSEWGPFAGFALAAVLAWFLMLLLFKIFGKLFTSKASPIINVLGGFLLGGIWVFFALSFFAQLILLAPVNAPKKLFSRDYSYSGYSLAQTAPLTYQTAAKWTKLILRR